MCTLSFKGKGYSKKFVKNYAKIYEALHKDENIKIQIVEYMDNICDPCPNKINDRICKTQDKIEKLDSAHKKILQLEFGEYITWKEAKKRIQDKMSIDKFHKACDGCSWKKYGICEQQLSNLIKESKIID